MGFVFSQVVHCINGATLNWRIELVSELCELLLIVYTLKSKPDLYHLFD